MTDKLEQLRQRVAELEQELAQERKHMDGYYANNTLNWFRAGQQAYRMRSENERLRQRIAEMEQARIPATFFGPEHNCGDCGASKRVVRSWWWQCPECE